MFATFGDTYTHYERYPKPYTDKRRQESEKNKSGADCPEQTVTHNKMVYENKEFAHLKWRLMNQEGLSEKESEKRIEKIKDWDKKIKMENKIKKTGKKE